MVIAGLVLRMRIIQESFARSDVFLICTIHQINFRNFVENKIRESRFALIVWSAHLNA